MPFEILIILKTLEHCLFNRPGVAGHEIFLFQNMLSIKASIKLVLLFFFKFGLEIFLKSKVSKILVSKTRAWISFLLELPLAWISLLLKVPQHECKCYSKYHSMTFIVTLSHGFICGFTAWIFSVSYVNISQTKFEKIT